MSSAQESAARAWLPVGQRRSLELLLQSSSIFETSFPPLEKSNGSPGRLCSSRPPDPWLRLSAKISWKKPDAGPFWTDGVNPPPLRNGSPLRPDFRRSTLPCLRSLPHSQSRHPDLRFRSKSRVLCVSEPGMCSVPSFVPSRGPFLVCHVAAARGIPKNQRCLTSCQRIGSASHIDAG